MIIDFHTHIFPDKLAERAVSALSATANIPPAFDGTADGLIRYMDEKSVDYSVVLNIATKGAQTVNVNTFAIETKAKYPRLIPFGSLHPDSENKLDELKRLQSNGINGIKIHPDYIGMTIDDKRMDGIFEAACKMNTLVVTHTGYDALSPSFYHATAGMIAAVKDRFPSLRLVCAHFGANLMWDETLEQLCGQDNLWIDTSLGGDLGLPAEKAAKIIEKHGEDKILFGSDLPWSEPIRVKAFLQSLGLSNDAMEKILWRNAYNLLGLNC